MELAGAEGVESAWFSFAEGLRARSAAGCAARTIAGGAPTRREVRAEAGELVVDVAELVREPVE